jgi:hypothetical protein
LGSATVPCIRSRLLTAGDKRAFIIADNRLAQLSSWDEDILATELRDLASVKLLPRRGHLAIRGERQAHSLSGRLSHLRQMLVVGSMAVKGEHELMHKAG